MQILFHYLQYDFVQTAFVVALLIAFSSSLLGVPLVLRRCSFVGDSLSHTAFFATTVATLAGITNSFKLTLLITTIVSFVMLRRKSSGDSFLAMVSVLTLAVGYISINLSNSANVSGDVCGVLFGSTQVLTLGNGDVIECLVSAVFVAILLAVTYHKILRLTFDRSYSVTNGENAVFTDAIFSVMVGLVITVAVKFVGALLVTALIVLPSSGAMMVARSYKSAVIMSCITSVICAAVGLSISIIAGTPVGSTVVIADALAAGVFYVFRKVVQKR